MSKKVEVSLQCEENNSYPKQDQTSPRTHISLKTNSQNNHTVNCTTPCTPSSMGIATSPEEFGIGVPNTDVFAGPLAAPNFNQQQQQLPPGIQAKIAEIEHRIRAKYPNMSQQFAHGQALHIMQQRLMQNEVTENNDAQIAMDLAAESPLQPESIVNEMQAATCPHQSTHDKAVPTAGRC